MTSLDHPSLSPTVINVALVDAKCAAAAEAFRSSLVATQKSFAMSMAHARGAGQAVLEYKLQLRAAIDRLPELQGTQVEDLFRATCLSALGVNAHQAVKLVSTFRRCRELTPVATLCTRQPIPDDFLKPEELQEMKARRAQIDQRARERRAQSPAAVSAAVAPVPSAPVPDTATPLSTTVVPVLAELLSAAGAPAVIGELLSKVRFADTPPGEVALWAAWLCDIVGRQRPRRKKAHAADAQTMDLGLPPFAAPKSAK